MSQISALQNTLAYKQQRAFEILCKALEAFEGYLVKTDRMINTPQIYGKGKWIKDGNGSFWDLQETFLIHLNMCGITFAHRDTDFATKKLVKEQFYIWLANMWGEILPSECPPDLAHFLIETHDILDGNKAKITRENMKHETSIKKPSVNLYNDSFFDYQQQIHGVDQRRESFGNKTSAEVGLQGKFNGGEQEIKKGEEIYNTIERKYRREHEIYPLFVPFDKRQPVRDQSFL